MVGINYCELCSKEERNGKSTKHITSEEQLLYEDKYCCDLCKKNLHWRYHGPFKNKRENAEICHKHNSGVAGSAPSEHELNQKRLDSYYS